MDLSSVVFVEDSQEEPRLCRRRYRDRSMLHVDAAALLAVLRPALAMLGCRDAPGWTNPFGKTCQAREPGDLADLRRQLVVVWSPCALSDVLWVT